MTSAAFKRLCLIIGLVWEKKQGAVAVLSKPREETNLRICVGPVTNRGVMAENCTVWLGDNLLYTGPIESKELHSLLTAERVCRALVTNVSRLDSSKQCPVCLMRRTSRCPKTCKARPPDAQLISLQGAGSSVR